MSGENDLVFDAAPEVGVQNDGEPVAVVAEPEPEVAPEAEPAEPEKTPEEVEEHKRLTGSARQKAKAERLAQENRDLQDRLARLEAQISKPEAAKPAQEGKPTQDQFETHAEWVEALTDWKVEQKTAEREAKANNEKITTSWEEKKAEARKELPDFDEVLADMIQPAPVVVAVMNESPYTAKIAYHLAENPDELQRINRLSPAGAALAIAEIAASFKAPKNTPAPKPVSKAPKPPTPVTAPSGVKPSDDGRVVTY